MSHAYSEPAFFLWRTRMMSGLFADAIPLFMVGGHSFRELRGAPPEGICGSPEKHDSKTNTGSDWLHCNRVGNQGHGRDYENDWSERISWYAIRASGIWRTFAIDENACRGKRIKNPADKDHVGQQLLIGSARGEHHGPQSRRADGECRCSKSRMDARERGKEKSVFCHRVIDA